jgi:deoxyribonuclease-4
MKIGAHVSTSGGFDKALIRLSEIGGSTMQIFSSSPRGWNFAKVHEKDIILFKEQRPKLAIDPVYFHASYLINLADDGRIGHLSTMSLIAELNVASQLGISGSIVHLGSYKGQKNNEKNKTLIKHLIEVLEATPADTLFIIENAGNNKIGQSLDELAQIIHDIEASLRDIATMNRLRVCLDTCHLFSAGYDLRTTEKLESFLRVFDAKIGLNKLEVWHFNDSKDPFESGRDRHENIGKGTIGLDEFRLILNHPKLNQLPYIIEVPGFDGNGPDKANIDILKSLL